MTKPDGGREIKFRAWDTIEQRMVLLNVPYEEGFIDIVDGCIVPASDQSKRRFIFLQYTGLLDKNGKEIFEGDILDYGEWQDGKGERAVVSWHEKLARFGLDFFSEYGGEGYTGKNQHLVDYQEQCEVIGNIYESPELLKGAS